MTDPTPPLDTDSDYPGTPRWVKVFGMILIALIALVLVLRLTGGGGRHGPGRHMSPAETSGRSAPHSGAAKHMLPERAR